MSVINTQIPTQSFELVRNRIAEILLDELSNQYDLSYDDGIDVTEVSVERFVPFDITELPAVNVMLSRGMLTSHSAIHSDGTYTFYIDIHHSGKTTDENRGDTLAMVKVQRLAGMCRAILEDTRYKTLGFTPPFIMNRHVEDINFDVGNDQDMHNAVMARITFMVRVNENVPVITPTLLAGYETSVKLSTTDKGYIFSIAP